MAVWDIRRPYIQYAAFVEHTDDVAGGCGCLTEFMN